MAKPVIDSEIFIDQLIVQIRIHLQSVGGVFITAGTIAPSPLPIPGFKTWIGYTIPPSGAVNPNPVAGSEGGVDGTTTQTGLQGFVGDDVAELVFDAEFDRDFLVEGDINRPTPTITPTTPTTTPSPENSERSDTRTEVNELEPLQFGGESSNQAKILVENYYGKPISDEEFQLLIRAIAGESGGGDLEDAAIASVILNRAKTNFGQYGGSIRGQLYAKNQFQAVTGAGGSGASKSFLNPTKNQIARATNNILNNLETFRVKNWLNFTAENPAAYGVGTNLNFRTRALNTPGMQIIGVGRNKTIFFTDVRS